MTARAALATLTQDVRYALRMMRRAPGSTAIALLSLGLGIGANTAIFSLIHTLMLRLLPVRDPQQLPSVPKASIRKSWDTWRVTSSRSLGSSWRSGR